MVSRSHEEEGQTAGGEEEDIDVQEQGGGHGLKHGDGGRGHGDGVDGI